MQTTSATWKNLCASQSAYLESMATIAGTDYTEISSPTINRALTQAGLSIGNAVSATCRFSVRTDANIPDGAEVRIKMRFSNGTTNSEWLPAGTYYISHRRVDPVAGLMELECFDAMLKANSEYEPTGSWPRAMTALVTEIAGLLGVSLDTRTQILTGENYMVPLPESGTTINTILGWIAAVHGGNWVITPENKLRLVVITSSANASTASSYVQVQGIVGSIYTYPVQTITGLRVRLTDDVIVYGSEDGLVIETNSPYVNDGNVSELTQRLVGKTYQPFVLSSAIYDPAVEVGDYVRGGADDEIASVLYSEDATLGIMFRGDISAPQISELDDEYPYISAAQTMADRINRLTTVVADKASVGDLEAVTAKLDNLSANDIKAGVIHSADYQTVIITKIYPSSGLYPSNATYANNGERVVRGFAIDFSAGQILGGFYSEQITGLQSDVSDIQSDVSELELDISGLESALSGLQSAVTALQNALVYPKAATSGLQSFSPLNMTGPMSDEIHAVDSDQINDETSADSTVEEDE